MMPSAYRGVAIAIKYKAFFLTERSTESVAPTIPIGARVSQGLARIGLVAKESCG